METFPIYRAVIQTSEDGINILSMVKDPAIMEKYVKLSKEQEAEVKLAVIDESQGIVFGPALVPNLVIPRVAKDGTRFGLMFDSSTIQDCLVKMSAENKTNNVDVQHSEKLISGITVFEKFITDENRASSVKNFEHLPMGTMFFTGKISDPVLLAEVKAGNINGWSIDGMFTFDKQTELSMEEILSVIKNI